MCQRSPVIGSLLLALVIIAAHQSAAVNYCNPSFCGSAKHIACNNSGNFLPSCPAGARMVTMNAELKNVLLKAHNEKRNFIAGGNVAKLPAACRMATMQWDNELAEMAALNVRRCIMQHDACRNTVKFKKSGQNLARLGTTTSNVNHTQNLRWAVNFWYAEVKYVKLAHIRSYPRNYKGPDIGHFTVSMTEKNIRVGCAASMYKSGQFNQYLIGCNYATTNIYGKPIYRGCNKPAAQCNTGTDRNFKNLCSAAEKYAVNVN